MTVDPIAFESHSEADTDRLGELLARDLPDGTVVSLTGTLGAGKTRLVRAIVTASGLPGEMVTSPTFVLCHEYPARRMIYHLDWYRVRDEQELVELGIDEYFASQGLVLIEWGERFPHALPPSRLDVTIEITGPTRRRFRFYPREISFSFSISPSG